MSFTDFDIEDLKSTKKAVWTLSCAILLISALDLRSDEISLLGLKVGVSQEKIVTIIRMILALPLLRYILVQFHDLMQDYAERVDLKQKSETEEDKRKLLQEHLNAPTIDEVLKNWGPDLAKHFEKLNEREDNLRRINRASNALYSITAHIIPKVTIVSLGISAMLYPNILKQTLSYLESKPAVEQQAEQTTPTEPVQSPTE